VCRIASDPAKLVAVPFSDSAGLRIRTAPGDITLNARRKFRNIRGVMAVLSKSVDDLLVNAFVGKKHHADFLVIG
jgi:hypothetical protein